MRRGFRRLIPLFILMAAVALPAGAADKPKAAAPGPRAQFNAAIEKLKSNPADNAAREDVVRLAPMLKPAPAIPQAAHDSFITAGFLLKKSADARGAALAVTEYEKAIAAAPWWADAYFNNAQALATAGRRADAQRALELYLLSGPSGADAEQARNKMLELKADALLEEAKKSFSGTYGEVLSSGQIIPHGLTIERADSGFLIRRPNAAAITPTVNGSRIEWREPGWVSDTDYSLTLSDDGSRLEGTRNCRRPTAAQLADFHAKQGAGSTLDESNWRTFPAQYIRE